MLYWKSWSQAGSDKPKRLMQQYMLAPVLRNIPDIMCTQAEHLSHLKKLGNTAACKLCSLCTLATEAASLHMTVSPEQSSKQAAVASTGRRTFQEAGFDSFAFSTKRFQNLRVATSSVGLQILIAK